MSSVKMKKKKKNSRTALNKHTSVQCKNCTK